MKRLPIVLGRPGSGCALPPGSRICFAPSCPENVNARLRPGQDHATRCGRDELAPGFATGPGTRHDERGCAWAAACEELYFERVKGLDTTVEADVHCPATCVGFKAPVVSLGRRSGT